MYISLVLTEEDIRAESRHKHIEDLTGFDFDLSKHGIVRSGIEWFYLASYIVIIRGDKQRVYKNRWPDIGQP